MGVNGNPMSIKDTLEVVIDPQAPHGFRIKMTATSDQGRTEMLSVVNNFISKIKEIKVEIKNADY